MTPHRTLPIAVCALLAFTLATPRAFAVNKDMVALQTEVQDLQNAVSHLQQTNDERMGVLKDLVQQTADAVNKMSVTVTDLQQQMRQQQEASGTKIDQVSSQMQSLNDSVDEVKARLNNLDKALQAVQSSQQSINATLQNLQPQQPAATPGADQGQPGAAPNQPGGAPAQPGMSPQADNSKPSAGIPFTAQQGPYAGARSLPPAQPSGAPVGDIYKTALNDYMAAKYSISVDEFNQVIQANPSDQLSGNSYYYLGEIDFRAGKFPAAVKDYDHVLNDYPGNQKAAVSHLHKAMALDKLKERDAAIAEFRAVVQRFPNSPEAGQARSWLNGHGITPTARRE